MMINFVIKTLDSIDHFFSVDDGITVRELKERVMEELGVPTTMQRLIFCGRVLQDEKRLSEYAVNNKVVHMVQRPPPGVENRQSSNRERDGGSTSGDSSSSSTPSTPTHQERATAPDGAVRNIVYWDGPEGAETPPASATTSRIRYFRKIIQDIRSLLRIIARTEHETAEHNDPIPRLEDMENVTTPEEASLEDSPRSPRQNTVNDAGELETIPGQLGDMIGELRFLERTFHRYRDAYVQILRDCDDQSVSLSTEDIHHRQRQADIAAELFHSFAHAYHLISDITLSIERDRNSRLSSEPTPTHTLPIYTQVDVGESLRGASTSNDDGQSTSAQNAEANQTDGPPPELDNIVRGLSDIARIENLEVVMSLEEVTPARLLGHIRDQIRPNLQQTSDPLNHIIDGGGNVQPLIGHHQIFVAQMPFGTQPTDEVFQNMVSSVVRQNIIPGMEAGIQAQIINGMQSQAANRPQNQSEASSQNASQEQAPNRQSERPDQNAAPTASQSQSSQNQNIPPERESNPEQSENYQQRPNVSRPRVWARTRRFSCVHYTYDKFLQCNSHHCRRVVARRNDDDIDLDSESMAEETSAPTPPSKTNLLFELLDQASVGLEYLVIAGIILIDVTADLPESSAWTSEGLLNMRERFEGHIYDMMEHHNQPGMFEQQADFINTMLALVPMRPEFDVVVSLRMAFYQYLDELTAMMLMDSSNEAFLRYFRNFANQIFSQVCGVIAKCSRDGVEAVRVLHDAFLGHVLQNVDEPLRAVITEVSLQNLNLAIDRVTANRTATHYLVRTTDGPSTSTGRTGVCAMDFFSGYEPMRTTPPMTPASGTSVTPTSYTAEMPLDVGDIPLPPTECPNPAPEADSTVLEPYDSDEEDHLPQSSFMNTQPERRTGPSPRNLPYTRTYRRPWSCTSSGTSDIITVIVPPEEIITHFGEDWVPTFTRDIRLQPFPEEPYSNAYMAGMPPHKRRCIRQGRPTPNFSSFVNDTVREASRIAAVPPSRGFRMTFQEHIRTLTELRTTTSEDYDPQRFIATARFVNRQRDRDWVPPENKPE